MGESVVAPELYAQLQDIQSRLYENPEYEWAVTLSGREANDLFLNKGGTGFEEISGISGFDSEADGRVVAIFDYNRDGFQDLAVVNANAPRLQLFHNQLGDQQERSVKQVVAVRAESGCGIQLTLSAASGKRWTREVHCGEGFAAQNSATELFAVPDVEESLKLEIVWPGSDTTVFESVRPGDLVKLDVLQKRVSRTRY